MLMNVGPTHDGRIIPIFQERLMQMGEFYIPVCVRHVSACPMYLLCLLHLSRELAQDQWRGHL